MKKFIYTLLTCALVFSFSITTYATSLGDGDGDNNPSENTGGGGGGGPSGPVVDIPGGCSTHIEFDAETGTFTYDHNGQCDNSTAYTPVVTALHSVNGLLANAGEAVYFIPALEDFPVNLVDACADITTYDGKRHQFAVVYDGYFNTEALMNVAIPDAWDTQDVGRMQTSKRVYSQTDNSRCLNLLGYDLLLANEQVSLVDNGTVTCMYYPTLVGTAPLTTKTIMMDLYKAVGQVEWDIKVTHGVDHDLAINTSPIMQQIPVELSGDVPGGIWTEEGATYVWATRTNPDLYWVRCQRDAIFDGGAHTYTAPVYVGNDVSVSFSKTESSYMTMSEFLQVARAVMELYGESVITEAEMDLALYEYALVLPSSMDDATLEDIKYLAAKGIIEPDKLDYTKNVTFADIEPILLRIADEASRLTFKSTVNPAHIMTQRGYVQADVILDESSYTGFDTVTNPYDSDYYDYFIEARDNYTNFYLRKVSGINYEEQPNYGNEGITPPNYVGDVPVGEPPERTEYNTTVFAADKLVLMNDEGNGFTTPGSGKFENLGIKELHGKHYYHFKIARDVSEVTIKYNADPVTEELMDITSYTLPSASGGVYNVDESGSWSHTTFNEANYSEVFIDSERCNDVNDVFELTESYLDDRWYWYLVTYPTDTFNVSSNPLLTDKDGNNLLLAQDVETIIDNGRHVIDSIGTTVYATRDLTLDPAVSNISNTFVLYQTKLSEEEFKKLLAVGKLSNGRGSNLFNGYYKSENDTLLVSLQALLDAKKVTSWEFNTETNCLILATKAGNVILDGNNMNIIVGDTVVGANVSEDIYYREGTDYYINYRAIEGWTGETCYTVGAGNVIPSAPRSDARTTHKYTTATVANHFPYSLTSVRNVETRRQNTVMRKGISMYSTYPLANYVIVYGDVNNTDTLFVWHYKDVKLPDGSNHTTGGDAASQFESMTGISLSGVNEDYILVSYPLSRTKSGGDNYGFTFYELDWVNARGQAGTNVYGYSYEPKKFNSIEDALKAYHSGSDSCVLPIAAIGAGNTYVNLNMNVCRNMVDDSLFPVGQLPYKMTTKAKANENSMGIWTTVSQVKPTNEIFDDMSNLEIVAAPTSIFARMRGMNNASINQLRKVDLFFGSSKVTYLANLRDGVVTINGLELSLEKTTEAMQSFKGSTSDIWVIQANTTSLGDIVEDIASDIEVLTEDPERMIDWNKYTFSRLVENMDGWSSVALIFVLNILPRVGMLLFFALMLLALIKNVRPWRMFCERVFDIYSFLSFGKMNVNTVDTKRLVWISLICLAIFSIIMDGLLFQFIIWVCEWFIVLYKR